MLRKGSFLLVVLALLLGISGSLTAQDELLSFSAPDCSYGGEFQTIEAVDERTVKFTLCVPDPAFPAKVAFSAFIIQSSDYLESTGGGGDLFTVVPLPGLLGLLGIGR